MTTADPEFSVEELAARVGVPTSTVRMYQTKGLLHAPRKVGRTARYDLSHLQRLELVSRLQERGFSLPAIAELIAARDQGATVADVLGLPGGPGDEDWVPFGLRELRTMVKARELRPELLGKATRLGLVRWRRGRPQARRWALSTGMRVCELEVPPGDVLDRFTRLRGHTDTIAADFVELFEQRLWPGLAENSGRTDQLDRMRELLEELAGIAEGVVIGALRESVRAAAESFAQRHELLPADGASPAWSRRPVPVLAERLLATEPATAEIADAGGEIADFLATDLP
jgi:DNA-binding transcriptional MerR regulator